jgi:ankyrin repeat protein
MAADVSSNTHLYQYPAFESIWHSIDYNQFGDLVDSPELYEKINEKQQGLTPLHLAILRKNKLIVSFLLESGADPNILSKGRTPLYTATLHGEEQIVEALLEHGAEPDVMCRGIAPIHLASVKGRLDILELLTIHGANVSVRSPQYGTALHVAAKKNHKYISKFLVDNDIDLNVLTDEGETALHVACRAGYEDIVNLMLKSDLPLDPFVKDKVDGNTPLHVAALYQRWNIVRELSKKYPKLLTVLNGTEGKTPLFYVFAVLRDPIRESFVKAINKHHGFAVCINDTNTSDVVLLCKPPSDMATITPVKVSLGKSSDGRVKDESRVYVHKALLWARCPSLRSALPKLGKDPNSDLDAIDATKFSHAVLVNFAHYLYSDELRCSLPLMA